MKSLRRVSVLTALLLTVSTNAAFAQNYDSFQNQDVSWEQSSLLLDLLGNRSRGVSSGVLGILGILGNSNSGIIGSRAGGLNSGILNILQILGNTNGGINSGILGNSNGGINSGILGNRSGNLNSGIPGNSNRGMNSGIRGNRAGGMNAGRSNGDWGQFADRIQERLTQELNLTPAQQRQIQAIRARDEARITQQGEALKQAQQELNRLRETNASESAINGQQQRVERLRSEMRESMTASMSEMHSVLTPQQQAQLSQMMNARRQQMEQMRQQRQNRGNGNGQIRF